MNTQRCVECWLVKPCVPGMSACHACLKQLFPEKISLVAELQKQELQPKTSIDQVQFMRESSRIREILKDCPLGLKVEDFPEELQQVVPIAHKQGLLRIRKVDEGKFYHLPLTELEQVRSEFKLREDIIEFVGQGKTRQEIYFEFKSRGFDARTICALLERMEVEVSVQIHRHAQRSKKHRKFDFIRLVTTKENTALSA